MGHYLSGIGEGKTQPTLLNLFQKHRSVSLHVSIFALWLTMVAHKVKIGPHLYWADFDRLVINSSWSFT